MGGKIEEGKWGRERRRKESWAWIRKKWISMAALLLTRKTWEHQILWDSALKKKKIIKWEYLYLLCKYIIKIKYLKYVKSHLINHSVVLIVFKTDCSNMRAQLVTAVWHCRSISRSNCSMPCAWQASSPRSDIKWNGYYTFNDIFRYWFYIGITKLLTP